MSDENIEQGTYVEELPIEVEAGRTHVLEIQARPVEGTGIEPGQVTGCLEFKFTSSTLEVPPDYQKPFYLYLIGKDNDLILTCEIKDDERENGKKLIEDISVGKYSVSLQLATIFFDSNSDEVNSEAGEVLDELSEMLKKPVNSYISSLVCLGCSDINENDFFGYRRAAKASEKLNEKLGQEREIYIDIREGGKLGNEGEDEKIKYRRVDFYIKEVNNG